MRVVAGCVLLRWDVDHVSGITKGRHIRHMHANLERVARIRVDAQRVEPARLETLPFNHETLCTRLLLPVWPKQYASSQEDETADSR